MVVEDALVCPTVLKCSVVTHQRRAHLIQQPDGKGKRMYKKKGAELFSFIFLYVKYNLQSYLIFTMLILRIK